MRLGAIVIDSDNSDELSEFYRKMLGWAKEVQFFEDEKWIIVKSVENEATPLVFQEVADYARPQWPFVDGQQQMLHLDFYVKAEDFDAEIERAVSCGAVLSETQLSESWNVLLDPAGHPFCIIPIFG